MCVWCLYQKTPLRFVVEVPQGEWVIERDLDRLTQMLNDSAKVVRDAVRQGQQGARYGASL